MRKLFTILVAVLLTANVFAQSPEKMSYQAVIRNSSDALVTNQSVGMQISILQGSANGTAVYVETQIPITNANGLVSIEIGAGTVVSGDFTTIDWANGNYFIKTETDPTGGTNYSITGTNQLLSVPYALHAKTAETITGTFAETDPEFTAWDKDYADLTNTPTTITTAQSDAITANSGKDTTGIYHANRTALDAVSGTNTGDQDLSGIATNEQAIKDTAAQIRADLTPAHYVGELYGGGIVFWVTPDGQNGLIASLDDLDGGSGVAWSATQGTEIGDDAKSMTDGVNNTAAIVAQDATAGYAATLCNSYSNDGYTDWYLPSNRELYLLCSQDILIAYILDNDGDATTNGFLRESVAPTYGRYWSSTEFTSSNAWAYNFYGGYCHNSFSKDITYRVRAVRAF